MDDTEQAARWDIALLRCGQAGTAETDRLASEVLAHPAGRAYLIDRFHDEALGKAAWQIARRDVDQMVGEGREWIDRTVAWLGDGRADWQRSCEFTADVAWAARAVRNSALLHIGSRDLPDVIATSADRALLHLVLQSQRYDFRFRSIRETVNSLGVSIESLDPFSRAVHAFALLAQNDASGLAEFVAVQQVSGDHPKVAHALLHGLWMATDLPGQAEKILSYIEESESLRDDDSIVALRKAYALRKLRRYDEAFHSINLGMLNLSPAAPDVHQDFTRERAMIIVVRDIEEAYSHERKVLSDQATEHIARLDREVEQKATRIEDKVADSLFKLVEILGLFIAVVALLASGAASVTIGALEWWQRGLLMLVAGVVVMTFFFAMRVIVRPRRRRE